jgi:glycosyltransferase involved in cell wall biosynthesis
MDQNSLLSVCIPTYNNAACLKECLESLVAQVEPYRIPICVSDNASTDSTIEVLSSFKKERYPFLYFQSNDENLGFDKNAVKAATMASSKYVWSFGDRRRLLPNSFDRIYRTLSENDLSLLMLKLESAPQEYQVMPMRDKRYSSARKVFLELSFCAQTIGLQILPLEAWRSEVLKKYLNEEFRYWISYPAIYEFLASLKSVNAMFLALPTVDSTNRWGCQWESRYFQVWITWKNTINALPKVYSDDDKEFVIRYTAKLAFLSSTNLLWLRSKGVYNESMFNLFHEDFLKYTNTSLSLARTISMLPTAFLKLYYKLRSIGSKGMRTFIHTRAPLNPLEVHAFQPKPQQRVQN